MTCYIRHELKVADVATACQAIAPTRRFVPLRPGETKSGSASV